MRQILQFIRGETYAHANCYHTDFVDPYQSPHRLTFQTGRKRRYFNGQGTIKRNFLGDVAMLANFIGNGGLTEDGLDLGGSNFIGYVECVEIPHLSNHDIFSFWNEGLASVGKASSATSFEKNRIIQFRSGTPPAARVTVSRLVTITFEPGAKLFERPQW